MCAVVWECKCEGAIFSAFRIFSNDDAVPNTNLK